MAEPKQIGEILQQAATGILEATLAKKSKPKICPLCKKLKPPTLFDICGQCYRHQQFVVLPVDEQEHLIAQTIPPLFKDARLEHLSAKLIETIKELPEEKGLMLWGAAGVGKSYTLSALAREYIKQGFLIARSSYEMLCLRLRDSFKAKNTDTELSIIKPYLDTDKLILEDVGTTKGEGNIESDFSVRTLLVLLDYRLENCLPTFISTNRPVEELEKTFDARISSRLIKSCEIIKLTGNDRRKNGLQRIHKEPALA